MHCKLVTAYFLLITGSLFTVLSSCTTQTPQPPHEIAFYLYRSSPSAIVEFSPDFQSIAEMPISIPLYCGLLNVFPAPVGSFLLIELSCPNGQTVLFLNTDSAALTQPIIASDSHFLAWAIDGENVYLKVDLLGNPHVVRVSVDGKQESVSVTEFTYDLSAHPANHDFTFTFSRGLGQGSELQLAKDDGSVTKPLYADPLHYISFARFSPDGSQIAFLKIPDTATPFTVGELWVMDADGANARKLAEADAGHGYAANWSPDGKQIAFVVRENPEDEQANQLAEALVSNIYLIDVKSGAQTQITKFENGHVETPVWSPEGNTLAFTAVIDDRMEVRIAELTTGEIRSLGAESTCCPAWLRK